MTNELQIELSAAAKRFIAVKDGAPPLEVYAEKQNAKASLRMLGDAFLLAEAHISEHPEDDDEPIGPQAFEAFFFQFHRDWGPTGTYSLGAPHTWCYVTARPLAEDPKRFDFVVGDEIVPKVFEIRTRGDLHRLIGRLRRMGIRGHQDNREKV